jgi:hypothetical protein
MGFSRSTQVIAVVCGLLVLFAIFFPPWTIPQTELAIRWYDRVLQAEEKRDEEALKRRQDAISFLKTGQSNLPVAPSGLDELRSALEETGGIAPLPTGPESPGNRAPASAALREIDELLGTPVVPAAPSAPASAPKQPVPAAPSAAPPAVPSAAPGQKSTIAEFLKQRTTERERVMARVQSRLAEQDRIRAIRTLLETGGIPANLQVSPEERNAASQEPLPTVSHIGRRIQHGFVFSPPVIGPLPVSIYTQMLFVEILGILCAGGFAWLIVTLVASRKGANP